MAIVILILGDVQAVQVPQTPGALERLRNFIPWVD